LPVERVAELAVKDRIPAIYPFEPGEQNAHASHTQFARRANVPQRAWIALSPKSAATFAPSRLR